MSHTSDNGCNDRIMNSDVNQGVSHLALVMMKAMTEQ